LFSAYGAAEGAITGFGMGASLDAAVHMSKADRSSSGQGEARPERQRLSGGEIKKLKQAGLDPEELKQFDGKADLFKDKSGDICVHPKDGSGPGEPTGYNINNLPKPDQQ